MTLTATFLENIAKDPKTHIVYAVPAEPSCKVSVFHDIRFSKLGYSFEGTGHRVFFFTVNNQLEISGFSRLSTEIIATFTQHLMTDTTSTSGIEVGRINLLGKGFNQMKILLLFIRNRAVFKT